MTSSQEVLLSPLVSAKGLSTQRYVDALFANSKHFCAESRLKTVLSTGITVEYHPPEREQG
ncbi:hypothetical protein V7S43_004535 [Phytophthora oleae]|uniref:Uncharacterized protein n=1 Tax=Phytophthora oleae TaxID=2107226 RepID=A0ABD3FW88_9STRA